ncbi:MAG TPA: hypothetical protein VGD05_13190 [Pyrinomonadaceae bacterium]|jgi:uncharacterized protein YhfF
MKVSIQVKEFWRGFCEEHLQVNLNTPYQVRYFGLGSKDSEELLNLVREGKKRQRLRSSGNMKTNRKTRRLLAVTASLRILKAFRNVFCEQPNFAFCRFRKLTLNLPLTKATKVFDYWREVHWDYFSRRCAMIGKEPKMEMFVDCERLKLLCPKEIGDKHLKIIEY